MTVSMPVQLSYCSIACLPDALFRSLPMPDLAADLARWLSVKKQARDVWASVIGRLLLLRSRHALGADQCRLVDLERLAAGDPKLPTSYCGSISHNEEMVAAVAAPAGAIGIDIEPRELPSDYRRSAASNFSPEERSLLREEGGSDLFAFLWTRKEALAKASGHALQDILAFPVLTDDPVLKVRQWHLRSLVLRTTQQCAIAFDQRSLDLRFDEVSFQSLLASAPAPARRA
jgi:phosphopantetheinyl transferase